MWCIRNPNQAKKRNVCVTYALRAQKRADGRARAEIWKMLRIVWNILSFDQSVIFSNFKFWRARTRFLWRAHWSKFNKAIAFDLKFMSMKNYCEIILFSSEDMNDHVTKSENHKMAPTWRHAWVISMKMVCGNQLHDIINDHGNFHVDWMMRT